MSVDGTATARVSDDVDGAGYARSTRRCSSSSPRRSGPPSWTTSCRWSTSARSSLPPDDEGVVLGRIAIDGPTSGVVSVALPALAARDAAARMFDMEPAAVAPEDVHDATGEITNMIGGNVKAMLAGEHRLGLPSVTDRPTGPGQDDTLASATLLWGEHALLVTLDRAAGGTTP